MVHWSSNLIWLWLLQILVLALMCSLTVNKICDWDRRPCMDWKQSKQNDIIAWITSPRSAKDKDTSLWRGGDDKSSCSSVLMSSHFQSLLTSNDGVCANKTVSHFQQECASVCLLSLLSLTTFSLSLSLSLSLISPQQTLTTRLSSWLN